MTKEEFIEKCKAIYMIDSMDKDNEIEIVGRKKSEDGYITSGDVVIIDLEADSCDIYYVFTYEEYDSLLTVREIDREKLLMLQALGKSYGVAWNGFLLLPIFFDLQLPSLPVTELTDIMS